MAFLGTLDGLLWDSQTKARWLNSKQKQQCFSKLLSAQKGEEGPGETTAQRLLETLYQEFTFVCDCLHCSLQTVV